MTKIEFEDNPMRGASPEPITGQPSAPAYSNGIRAFKDLENLEINSIDSYARLMQIFGELRKDGYSFLYGGLSDSRYSLLPTIARPCHDGKDLIPAEKRILSDFKDAAADRDWLKYKLDREEEDMFYMAVGRHMGLSCRLLDWTAGIDVAMSFVSRQDIDTDGTLWVLVLDNTKVKYEDMGFSPFGIRDDRLHVVKESNIFPDGECLSDMPLGIVRRYRQHGFFTVSSDSNISVLHNDIATEGMVFISYSISSGTKKMLSPALGVHDGITDVHTDEMVASLMSKY